MGELDRLFGGGLVEGSLILVGGEPGVGKSTLMLQIANALAVQGLTVLYICGEESAEQTSLRAKRLSIDHQNLYLLSETNFSAIRAQIDQMKPDVAIVDSVQIVYKSELPSSPGSVVQVQGDRHRVHALGQRARDHDLSNRTCDEIGRTGRPARFGAHRRHGARFRRGPAARIQTAPRHQKSVRRNR